MDAVLIDQASEQFLGQWKRLVSTTNWEKGAIIYAWRMALRDAGAPAVEFSDDAWSRRVGSVTPQHVGRLRRVYERFFRVHDEYAGLYWSHFQAALDWDDAEMWLEGAVQSGWSISDMRYQRWEATGGAASSQPRDDDPSLAEPVDEDAEPPDAGDVLSGTLGVVHAPERIEADEEDDTEGYDHGQFDDDESHDETPTTRSERDAVRPFANLPPLPADVSDAFETYKLCILRHKLAGWQEISCDDLLVTLDSLKHLALAPAEV